MTSQLKVLQYNVHTTEDIVIAPLFPNPRISHFTVLAVQEPWRNPRIQTTHNPSSSAFYLFYSPSDDASVCFFVNKSLNPSSYSAYFPTPKFGYLHLRSSANGVKDIMIHNVYRTQNFPPTSSENQPLGELLPLDTHEIISFVHAALSDQSADHLLLGDFNIHHPNWGGPNARAEYASPLLLSSQEIYILTLLLPPKTITCQKHGGKSTIDLVFSSPFLSSSVTACGSREDLDQGSDHLPIETSFLFSPKFSPHVPKTLCWKAYKVALTVRARKLDLMPRSYDNIEDIDAGVDRLVRWIKEAVAQHVPLSTLASFSVPWWSSELTQLVSNTRRARRGHNRRPCAEAWEAYLAAPCAKRKAIKTSKAAHFKKAVADAASGGRGIWTLARWAKTRSHLPATPLLISTLVTPSGSATTPQEEAEALKMGFFPPIPDAVLSDIPNTMYPPEQPSPMSISEEEITSVIKKAHPFKAAGSNSIPFFVLKCLGSSLVSYLQPLFQACVNFSYHRTAFCHCNTVPLKKPGKGDYPALGAWQPIALLNTLGKVLESIIARRIWTLSEKHSLLPAQHMGDRPGRSMDTALDFLIQQIHATWQNKDGVATLLLLDMTGALDRVVPARLLHNMRERRIPEWIVKWVSSFISNRTTTLCMPGYNTDAFPTHKGIPQGLPLSPIRFLFYNANLVDICNPPTLPASSNGFVDDVNALAYG
jgi:hypothetical protein